MNELETWKYIRTIMQSYEFIEFMEYTTTSITCICGRKLNNMADVYNHIPEMDEYYKLRGFNI